MRLAARVKRLELKRGGACGVCGGLGRLELVIQEPDGTVPEAEGCPACGEVMKIILIAADPEERHAQAAG